ncbi:MAG TPA: HypC/HybG/HupF family hydrogenase formation chaperone [Conexibacter sp.]|nr:HypC/HybG/HupF family hydrogenase formation chaperone [Conexibacter sp.]
MTARDLGPPSCHCVTCADEGVPMRVLGMEGAAGLARCAGDDGAETTVDTTLVEPVAAGERVLVHAGVALVKLDEREAAGAAAP